MDDLYFIKNVATGYIKIGRSRDVRSRLDQLQRDSFCHLLLCGVIPGAGEIERQVHSTFKAQRVRGEWFAKSDELMAFIRPYARRMEPSVPPKQKRLTNRGRKERLTTAVTENEAEQVRRAAAAAGATVSEWLRDLVLRESAMQSHAA